MARRLFLRLVLVSMFAPDSLLAPGLLRPNCYQVSEEHLDVIFCALLLNYLAWLVVNQMELLIDFVSDFSLLHQLLRAVIFVFHFLAQFYL